MEEEKSVLEPHQIEKYVKEMQCFPIEEILASRWIVQSCRFIQLSLQMSLEANQKKHLESRHQILLHSKAIVLAWELLTTEAWRRHVVPRLLSLGESELKTTLPLQLVLQTEVTVAGILESIFFEEETVTQAEAILLDVIDWAVRQLTEIAVLAIKQESNGAQLLYSPEEEFSRSEAIEDKASSENETIQMLNELKLEQRRIALVCGLRAVGLIQQMAMHTKVLPLCVRTRLLQNHDVPQLFSTLLEKKPWQRDHDGSLYYFEEGQWTTRTQSGFSISKVEVQLWLAIFSLLLDNDDFQMYEITSGRKVALLRLRPFLTETLIDEISALAPLSRFLSTLSTISAGPARSPPLVTTLPKIGESSVKAWQGKWQKLATFHSKRALTPEKEALMALASRFAAAYDLEALEHLLPQAPSCAMCGQPAGRKCSRCRTQWYCRRSCQVSHWKNHKSLCDLVANNSSKQELSNIIE